MSCAVKMRGGAEAAVRHGLEAELLVQSLA